MARTRKRTDEARQDRERSHQASAFSSAWLSPEFETRRRPPGVSTTAFTTHLPDLQPWPLMDMDFGISSPLVRPVLPHIRFLFVRSRLCSTLPSDPASRRRPCAQLHPSPSSGWVEDLHLRAVVHARHTAKGGMRYAFPPYGAMALKIFYYF